ncbi:50S ribosomal protein L18 [Ostreibacterium oceani]|uniref:Large ribosomal subunit protein uL18 n=1 Tax=Ostreibacterium oceani TaxID=2654998 RepID=A0A6N7ESC9_9GAMM|nr:50S ribosomal protein L18 [Ostreibacterium oceani]MPV85754.1 50S ribosomal protein L18 [Ostreibacterium oceani]
MNKKQAKIRRGLRARTAMKTRGDTRLVVNKSSRHIYAQVVAAEGGKVLASASTLNADIKGATNYTGNIDAAEAVGKAVAEKAVAAGVKKVAFDRSGHKYHGRIKRLADAAREAGLDF